MQVRYPLNNERVTHQAISDVVRLRQGDDLPSRSDIGSLPAPPPHLAPAPWTANSAMVSGRHLIPQNSVSTPNSARKGVSPNLNGAQRPTGTGAFPTTYTADNSLYGMLGPGGIPVAAPPPSWRLTEDSLASLRHVPMGEL